MEKQIFTIKGGNLETKISAKNRRAKGIVVKFGIVLAFAVTGGLLVSAVATAPAALAEPPAGTYTASLNDSLSDGTTWAYDVEVLDPPANGISHISLQTCFSETELNGGVLQSTSPGGAKIGDDPSTGFEDVIKWDFSFTTPTTVSITLDDVYGTGIARLIVKSGSKTGTVIIDVPGPNCTPAPEPATLTVIKQVINDNDGTNVASDFTMEVTGTNVSSSSFAGSETGVTVTLDAGSYSVDEADSLGYTKLVGSGCEGTISAGESKTCTIINDDPFVPEPDLGSITVCKVIIDHDNNVISGPSSPLAQFTIEGFTPSPVTSEGAPVGEIGTSVFNTPLVFNADLLSSHAGDDAECVKYDNLAIGGYFYSEETYPSIGWEIPLYNDQFDTSRGVSDLDDFFEYSGELFDGDTGNDSSRDKNVDGHIVLTSARPDRVLVVLNQTTPPAPEPATITVYKEVVNDNGGTATQADFQAQINGNDVPWGESQELPAGAYTVSEIMNVDGYTQTSIACGDVETDTVTLAEGESVECTITNDDQHGTIIVKKVVINDDGGALEADDFSFTVNGGSAVLFEADGENSIAVDAGVYTVSELTVDGYAATYENCTNVSVSNGGTATCTVTNDDNPPTEGTLKLVKTVINDNGGTAVEGDFQPKIDGENVGWNQVVALTVGEHTASEIALSGYLASDWGGDCATDGKVTVVAGEDKVCTITNDDISPELKVIKIVINDDGTLLNTASDFTMEVVGTNVSNSVFAGNESGVTVTLNAGSYSVDETDSLGYTKSLSAGCAGTIALGEIKICTITNDDPEPEPATLTLNKTVDNRHEGTLTADDFQAYIDGNPVDWSASVVLGAGTYTASEDLTGGYTASDWGGDCAANGTITLSPGDHAVCSITNYDPEPEPGTLIVKKIVINDDGGTKTAGEFSFSVNGGSAISFNEIEATNGENAITVDAGAYTVTEVAVAGYTTTYDNCESTAIGEGETATCTITNDDIAPTLTLVKNVINNDGGQLSANDFQAYMDGNEVDWNDTMTVSAGSYVLSEDAGEYTAGDWDCGQANLNGNTVTLGLDQNVTCSITNDDPVPEPAIITLVKQVVNNSGRSATAGDFALFVGGTELSTGESTQVNAGTYSLSESGPSGYNLVSIVCSNDQTGNEVTVGEGDEVTCVFTNNDTPTGGGGAPNLQIVKSVTPTNTTAGATVDYTIVVTNTGNLTATNTVLEDVLPAGITYTDTGLDTRTWNLGNMTPGSSQTVTFSGDIDVSALPGSYTNTATVQANNHGPRSDTATVTIGGVLGEEADPVLEITKVGDKTIVNPGGTINYTITITNTGEAPAVNLIVTDTLPAGFTLASDGSSVINWNVPLLAVGDTWEVSFLVNVASDIEVPGDYVNEVSATAENYAGQLFASYTVASAGQVLGETGTSPIEIALWLLAITILAGSALVFKKQVALIKEEN